jgi:hypothetical protein
MRAAARVILRVTNSTPRRGDSWLNRMPLDAWMPYASRALHGDPVRVDLGDAVGLRGWNGVVSSAATRAASPNISDVDAW